jgi:hypothetical protein
MKGTAQMRASREPASKNAQRRRRSVVKIGGG